MGRVLVGIGPNPKLNWKRCFISAALFFWRIELRLRPLTQILHRRLTCLPGDLPPPFAGVSGSADLHSRYCHLLPPEMKSSHRRSPDSPDGRNTFDSRKTAGGALEEIRRNSNPKSVPCSHTMKVLTAHIITMYTSTNLLD